MKVLAAMSGGVDSAVAAARLVAAGHDVTGVHLALNRNPQPYREGSRGCCSLEDAHDARRVADLLDIPFYVWDFSEQFQRDVVDDFVAEYRAGHTPNPCLRCNEKIKFAAVLERGLALGFDAVATGHYARVVDNGSELELHRAADPDKDQSYVLGVLDQDQLRRSLFPLADTPKPQVRAEAHSLGLKVADKPDSYDICFIPDGDTQGFLRAHLGASEGDIVTPYGEVLGRHEGYWNYTVGQRKGLGIGSPAPDGRPRYVLETRPETNQVVVGASELLSISRISATDAVWLASDDDGSEATNLFVQLRAHGAPIPVASLTRDREEGTISVVLEGSARGVARGQSMVVYRGSRVLGEGTINATAR